MKTRAAIQFTEILKDCFHQKLKPLGFKKKANNFYRNLGEIGHIIQLQKSAYGTKDDISFTVNIGIFSSIFWQAEYNYEGATEAPAFPKEPVCAIRKRIGSFINGKDIWFDVNGWKDIKPLKRELVEVLEEEILPFLEQIQTTQALLAYLEAGEENYRAIFLQFILNGELQITEKLPPLYAELVKASNERSIQFIQEKGRKYGVDVEMK